MGSFEGVSADMTVTHTIANTYDGLDIDLGKAAHTVTKALDYVGVDDRSHGRRVGLICHRVAHNLGWDRPIRHFVLIAGMIHDCGVSSTATHRKLVESLEWEGADDHCRRGAEFLRGFAPFSEYAAAIRHHHTRWNRLPGTLDQQTRLFANLVFLADRLDVARGNFLLARHQHEVLAERAELVGALAPYVGELFAPELFAALEQAARRDGFWLELEDEFLDQAIFETLATWDHSVHLRFDDIMALGEMISRIVDAKSPFTHYHSLRVADLAFHMSGLLGFSPQRRQMLRLAALLHDVGKLRTPDDILEKCGPLSPAEHDVMLRHPLDSKVVLTTLFPNTPIAQWAAHHHEKLNGSGYPYGWSGPQIDQETRLLTVCDIFQALCQKRPYRDRLQAGDVIEIMERMVAAGEIDPDLFALLRSHSPQLYTIAIREG